MSVRRMHQSNIGCFLASNYFIYDCFTQTHTHTDIQWSPFSDHPYLHLWPPFSALMVTLLCTHGHPSLHSWSSFSALMVTLSLQSSPFSALMVTLLCTHGHSVAYPERCPSAVGANIIKHYTFILYFSRKTSKSNNE